MSLIFSHLRARKKYMVDFSLIPYGILILEFSVFTTELSKSTSQNHFNILLMRLIHTVCMLILAFILSRIYQSLKKEQFSYLEISLPAFFVVSIGIFISRSLSTSLNIQLVSIYRNLGIGIFHSFFWFPVFMMVGSRRTQIFQSFREYEVRLISSTRAISRTSAKFRKLQVNVQENIRKELISKCKSLNDSISHIVSKNLTLSETNKEIQQELLGEELRNLSMRLETFGSEKLATNIFKQNLQSLKLLVGQFRILYFDTTQVAPLRPRIYTLVLMVLVTPAFINYFSLTEILVFYPLLALAVFLFSKLIVSALSSGTSNSQRNSSILIYMNGFIPFFVNRIGQSITKDENTDFPMFIGLVTLPVGYYLFIKLFQVLQPTAIEMIQNDTLRASEGLKMAISKQVSDEFSHTLAHRWAIYIHGKILTRLAATSLKIETATKSQNLQTFNAAISALCELLNNPDEEFESQVINLETEIASRLNPWAGLLEISLQIEEKLKIISNARVRDVGEVIEELISNSIRHGKAQHVHLNLSRVDKNDILILALDDSTVPPPDYQKRYGLGTRIFNLASDGRWSITRLVSSTEFRLIMAIEN